jgi:hypothetical protein
MIGYPLRFGFFHTPGQTRCLSVLTFCVGGGRNCPYRTGPVRVHRLSLETFELPVFQDGRFCPAWSPLRHGDAGRSAAFRGVT